MLLPLTSGLIFSSLFSKSMFCAICAIPMGGGAIAGLVQLETSKGYPISGAVSSWGSYIGNLFSGNQSQALTDNSQWTTDLFKAIVYAGQSISQFSLSASSTISSILSNLGKYYGYASSIYPELSPVFSFLRSEWATVQELLGKLWEQKSKVQKLVFQLFGQRQAIIELVKKIHANKQTYSEAFKWISEKAGGWKKVVEFLFDDSLKLFEELGKVSSQLSDISTQAEKIAKKLVSKKTEIDEIVKDLDLSTVKLEGSALTKLKSNWTHYLKKINEQEQDLDEVINTLKSKTESFKELFKEVGQNFSTYYENQEKLSNILNWDKKDVKIKEVFEQLKDIPKESYKNLKEVYDELVKSETKSKLVLKSAGSGAEALAKVIKGWENKYKALLKSDSK